MSRRPSRLSTTAFQHHKTTVDEYLKGLNRTPRSPRYSRLGLKKVTESGGSSEGINARPVPLEEIKDPPGKDTVLPEISPGSSGTEIGGSEFGEGIDEIADFFLKTLAGIEEEAEEEGEEEEEEENNEETVQPVNRRSRRKRPAIRSDDSTDDQLDILKCLAGSEKTKSRKKRARHFVPFNSLTLSRDPQNDNFRFSCSEDSEVQVHHDLESDPINSGTLDTSIDSPQSRTPLSNDGVKQLLSISKLRTMIHFPQLKLSRAGDVPKPRGYGNLSIPDTPKAAQRVKAGSGFSVTEEFMEFQENQEVPMERAKEHISGTLELADSSNFLYGSKEGRLNSISESITSKNGYSDIETRPQDDGKPKKYFAGSNDPKKSRRDNVITKAPLKCLSKHRSDFELPEVLKPTKRKRSGELELSAPDKRIQTPITLPRLRLRPITQYVIPPSDTESEDENDVTSQSFVQVEEDCINTESLQASISRRVIIGETREMGGGSAHFNSPRLAAKDRSKDTARDSEIQKIVSYIPPNNGYNHNDSVSNITGDNLEDTSDGEDSQQLPQVLPLGEDVETDLFDGQARIRSLNKEDTSDKPFRASSQQKPMADNEDGLEEVESDESNEVHFHNGSRRQTTVLLTSPSKSSSMRNPPQSPTSPPSGNITALNTIVTTVKASGQRHPRRDVDLPDSIMRYPKPTSYTRPKRVLIDEDEEQSVLSTLNAPRYMVSKAALKGDYFNNAQSMLNQGGPESSGYLSRQVRLFSIQNETIDEELEEDVEENAVKTPQVTRQALPNRTPSSRSHAYTSNSSPSIKELLGQMDPRRKSISGIFRSKTAASNFCPIVPLHTFTQKTLIPEIERTALTQRSESTQKNLSDIIVPEPRNFSRKLTRPFVPPFITPRSLALGTHTGKVQSATPGVVGQNGPDTIAPAGRNSNQKTSINPPPGILSKGGRNAFTARSGGGGALGMRGLHRSMTIRFEPLLKTVGSRAQTAAGKEGIWQTSVELNKSSTSRRWPSSNSIKPIRREKNIVSESRLGGLELEMETSESQKVDIREIASFAQVQEAW